MRIAMINTYSNGSTGSIAEYIGEKATANGDTVKYFYGRNKNNSGWIFIGERKFDLFFSNLLTLLTGKVGSFHFFSTKKLLKELANFDPEVIHLHNIHGNYLNFKMLFKYLSSFKGKVVITMHDEFLLTGRCALCECEKWKTGCNHCKHLNAYPRAWVDRSSALHKLKQKMLFSIKDLTLVTPSNWLKSYTEKSLINSIECKCVHNGVEDTRGTVFPVDDLVDQNKINILFAAFTWNIDKGSNVIKELCEIIDRKKYNIIIAGVEEYCSNMFGNNCKTVGLLPKDNLFYLLERVDLFINPTFKDNFPTILIESLKAGTPSITFNTGGCSEIIDDTCGIVVNDKTAIGLKKAIESFDFSKKNRDNCLLKAKEFSSSRMADEYLKIYKTK